MSNLDTVTEMQVSGALTARLGHRTCLIIAHRAATAARADLVAWLDDGKLRALRPHRELWQDPAYRSVFMPGSPESPESNGPDVPGVPAVPGVPDVPSVPAVPGLPAVPDVSGMPGVAAVAAVAAGPATSPGSAAADG
jgi:ATP-binding cassette subfamily B protein